MKNFIKIIQLNSGVLIQENYQVILLDVYQLDLIGIRIMLMKN